MEYRQVASSAFGKEDSLILLTPLPPDVRVLDVGDFVIGPLTGCVFVTLLWLAFVFKFIWSL